MQFEQLGLVRQSKVDVQFTQPGLPSVLDQEGVKRNAVKINTLTINRSCSFSFLLLLDLLKILLDLFLSTF